MAANTRFLNPKTLAEQHGYSYVVETTGPGRTVYIAGQLGLDLDNKLVGAPGDFRAQANRAIENLEAALASVGASLADVVKINSYLTDMSHLAIYREVRDQFFKMPRPASTTVAISQLARPGGLFEIEAVAVLPAKTAKPAKARGASRAGKAAKKAKGARKKRR
ncbi:MAG TPA: RidA family protein [Xanthobacteraceae bacterium]|jgi:enamine deaminase RidA (YjgF/YER057c/UK114 family)